MFNAYFISISTFKTSVFGKNLFSPSSWDKTNLIGSVSNFSEIAGRHLLATPWQAKSNIYLLLLEKKLTKYNILKVTYSYPYYNDTGYFRNILQYEKNYFIYIDVLKHVLLFGAH